MRYGIYDGKLSDNSNRLIETVDRGFDEAPLPIIAYDIDVTTEELCDTVDYLVNTILGGTLFARKVIYRNNDDRQKFNIGVLFSDDEEDFERFEKCGYYYPVDESPLVIGLHHNDYLRNQYEDMFPQETVLIKLNNGTILTRKNYEDMSKPIQKKKRISNLQKTRKI